MSKKNLTQNEEKKNKGIQLYFVFALLIILVYIFYPYDNQQPEPVIEKQPEIYIIVSNGCGIPDLAQKVATQLLVKGIDAMTWVNTDNTNCIHPETMIVIRQKSENQAEKLDWLKKETGIQKITKAYKKDSSTEFELVLGKDYINFFKID